jgi:hypothetical protein
MTETVEEIKEGQPILTDKQVEAIIRDSITKCQEQGAILTPNEWGCEWKKDAWVFKHKKEKTCCALDCVVLQAQEEDAKFKIDFRSWILEQKLQRDFFWLVFLWRGFDDSVLGSERLSDENVAAYEMGKRLRSEYITAKETDND